MIPEYLTSHAPPTYLALAGNMVRANQFLAGTLAAS